jgi:GT2 family glycosyltransferase
MTREKANYINAGHLVIHSSIFHEISGFDESLRTGEDYEFCLRAKANGISVINNPALQVIHEGYPQTLRAFVKREKWHGIQDFMDIKSFLRSGPAKAAALYWLFGLTFTMLSIYFKSFVYLGVGLGATTLLCIIATWKKQRQYQLSFVRYFLIYHVYFFARGLSLAERIIQRYKKKRNVS